MLKEEFINAISSEVEKENKQTLTSICECMKMILKEYPATTEIESSKTVKGCYKQMSGHAKNHAVDNSFCFTPLETEKFIKDYLGLGEIKKVRLEDFI